MAIFNSYVELPEGIKCQKQLQEVVKSKAENSDLPGEQTNKITENQQFTSKIN